MTTFTKKVIVTNDHKIIVELPPEYPIGEMTVTVTIDELSTKKKNPTAALRGIAKGKIRMADDFDEPLEELKEYV